MQDGKGLSNGPSCLKRWTIAAMCSFLMFLLLGIPRMASILYVECISRYGVSRKQAAFPFVLCFTSRFTSGPIHGYLGRRYGLRLVTAAGCVLSFLGTAACFFSTDITTISIFWGIVFGLGAGMGTNLLPLILNWYFGKNASKANGVCLAGSSLGAFLFPSITDFLLRKFGLSGTFLMYSAFILHTLPVALFLKKPKTNPANLHKLVDKENQPSSKPLSNCIASLSKDTNIIKELNFVQPDVKVPLNLVEYRKNGLEMNSSKTLLHDKCGQNREQFFVHDNDKLLNEQSKSISYILKSSPHPSYDYKSSEHQILFEKSSDSMPCMRKHLSNVIDTEHVSKSLITMERTNIKDDDIAKSKKEHNAFLIFLDPAFIVMMITQSSFLVLVTTIWTVILDHARDCGTSPDQEIYILMFFPAVDGLGCLFLGFITDGGYVSKITYCTISFICMSMTMIALAIANGFVMIIILSSFFGLFSSGIIIILPGITAQFIEENDRTMAMAARMSLFGPMNLTMPFIIGYFRGKLGSYSYLLLVLSALSGMCALLTAMTPYLSRRRKSQRHAIF